MPQILNLIVLEFNPFLHLHVFAPFKSHSKKRQLIIQNGTYHNYEIPVILFLGHLEFCRPTTTNTTGMPIFLFFFGFPDLFDQSSEDIKFIFLSPKSIFSHLRV